jgi:FixJ family two-component response regulator
MPESARLIYRLPEARMALQPPVVVVVEDDVPTLNALGRVLRAVGFEPALYSSCEDLRACPPAAVPICLLLDAYVKGSRDLNLQARIETFDPATPVIVMTALDDPRVRAEAHRMGCAGYFVKSSDPDLLSRQLRSLIPRTGDVFPEQ